MNWLWPLERVFIRFFFYVMRVVFVCIVCCACWTSSFFSAVVQMLNYKLVNPKLNINVDMVPSFTFKAYQIVKVNSKLIAHCSSILWFNANRFRIYYFFYLINWSSLFLLSTHKSFDDDAVLSMTNFLMV